MVPHVSHLLDNIHNSIYLPLRNNVISPWVSQRSSCVYFTQECPPCMHVHVGSEKSPDQTSEEIGHSDHMASKGYVLIVKRVSIRSMVLEGIYF